MIFSPALNMTSSCAYRITAPFLLLLLPAVCSTLLPGESRVQDAGTATTGSPVPDHRLMQFVQAWIENEMLQIIAAVPNMKIAVFEFVAEDKI